LRLPLRTHGSFKELTVIWILNPTANPPSVRLSYHAPGGEAVSFNVRFAARRIPTSFGGAGVRFLFACPIANCDHPAAKLFLPVNGGFKFFACRHCYRIDYLTHRQPWINRTRKVRRKLQIIQEELQKGNHPLLTAGYLEAANEILRELLDDSTFRSNSSTGGNIV
jgi:hypothetical protein